MRRSRRRERAGGSVRSVVSESHKYEVGVILTRKSVGRFDLLLQLAAGNGKAGDTKECLKPSCTRCHSEDCKEWGGTSHYMPFCSYTQGTRTTTE